MLLAPPPVQGMLRANSNSSDETMVENGVREKVKMEETGPEMGLSAYNLQRLSGLRRNKKRFPDEVQSMQRHNAFRPDDRMLMEAYLESEEPTNATIKIVNEIDNARAPAFDFVFVNGYVYNEKAIPPAPALQDLKIPKHCSCRGMCDPARCECRKMHRSLAPTPWMQLPEDFAYRKNGLLHQLIVDHDQTPIWECNSKCGCQGRCRNRVVGKGRKVNLQIVRTTWKGWGVRADQDLKAGQFVMQYSGELLSMKDADNRGMQYEQVNTTYVQELDPFYLQWHLYVPAFTRANPAAATRLANDKDQLLDAAADWYAKEFNNHDPILAVDAALWGNVSRFINHSCSPNLNLHPVYTVERDLRRPFFGFFAKRDIPKHEELTFSYSDSSSTQERVRDANVPLMSMRKIPKQLPKNPLGKMSGSSGLKDMVCRCGAPSCRGTVFA